MNLVARSSLAALLIKAYFAHISHAGGNIDKNSHDLKLEPATQVNENYKNVISRSCFALFAQEQRYDNISKFGKSAGTELFIRVPSPNEKDTYINTEDFIIHMSESGQLGRLTTKIIEKVIRNAAVLDRSQAPYYINVPPPLITPAFAKELALKLKQADLSTDLIGIEFTEREAILNRSNFDAGVAELKRIGITLALDDYGKGISTREFLTGLPVDRVKIDRSLLCDAQKDETKANQLQTDIQYMKKRGIEVIAEGIETADDYTFALNLGCDGIQGYFFDKPKMLIPVDV